MDFGFSAWKRSFHDFRPDAAGSTELRNFFQYIVVCIPEEGQTASEIIDLQASLDGSLRNKRYHQQS
jgi:hypothetical protein